MINKSLFSSNSDEWSTPEELFNSLDHEFHFTLDSCANELNKKVHHYYSIEDNGLIKEWKNNVVWCNPPYSNISKWVEKCFHEWFINHVTIVLLIPSRTDTIYFHKYIYPYAELRFIKGRLHFNNSKQGAPFPSMLCIFRGSL